MSAQEVTKISQDVERLKDGQEQMMKVLMEIQKDVAKQSTLFDSVKTLDKKMDDCRDSRPCNYAQEYKKDLDNFKLEVLRDNSNKEDGVEKTNKIFDMMKSVLSFIMVLGSMAWAVLSLAFQIGTYFPK